MKDTFFSANTKVLAEKKLSFNIIVFNVSLQPWSFFFCAAPRTNDNENGTIMERQLYVYKLHQYIEKLYYHFRSESVRHCNPTSLYICLVWKNWLKIFYSSKSLQGLLTKLITRTNHFSWRAFKTVECMLQTAKITS